ncbi:hypothetical protein CW362_20100 [Streptomyces populi]|uniref:Insertion element IS402-like domain-containing protein n=1 Tax=Streptomyces populi TaxID=2058924 RepID=A0A2I0SMS7_9ACTN|nr:hypothetical protein CW362_20100 [Streptomyces populi]
MSGNGGTVPEVGRGDLTHSEWARLAPLLPGDGRPGGRWSDHRTVINGILFRLRTGAPWRDVPSQCGPRKTVYERHRRWSADGTWDKTLRSLLAHADAGSRPPSRSRRTGSATASSSAPAVGGRRRSARTTTSSGTRSSAGSTASSASGLRMSDRG